MDTQTAINTLTALLNTVEGNVIAYNAQSDAIKTALQQLQGILNTPNTDLQNAIAERDQSKSEVEKLQLQIEELSKAGVSQTPEQTDQ